VKTLLTTVGNWYLPVIRWSVLSVRTSQGVNVFDTNAEMRAEDVQRPYRSPRILAIGKATDLLQGITGKHYDGSSGYYWDEEGG
jgi:hypothetical protein